MKKSTLAIALAFGVASAFAQDLTSKKGEPILPEAGDWAIGIDASPFLRYAGNLFNTAGNAAPTWEHLNANQTIIGKMFKDEKTAYRAILRIGLNSWTDVQKTAQPVSTPPTYPTLPTMVDDKAKASNTFIGLGAGYEMRRGKTRLQGYYGADAMFWMSSSKKKYTYGNATLSPSGTPPVTVGDSHNWNGDAVFGDNITTDPYGNAARVTEWKSGSTIGFGVRGFVGAEYFIFPKISIAGEFGWGIGITTGAKTSTTTESISGTNTSAITVEGGKSGGSFRIDTDQNKFGTGTGTLRLNLHF